MPKRPGKAVRPHQPSKRAAGNTRPASTMAGQFVYTANTSLTGSATLLPEPVKSKEDKKVTILMYKIYIYFRIRFDLVNSINTF